MLGTWMLPPLITTTEKSEYMDTELVSIECVCGLWYIGGSGESFDPLLSALYDPEVGRLDGCKVCLNV